MLSYHFWQQSLSSDPHIVGKSISINGTPFEVVGVMPQGFHGIKQELEPAELWTPISMQAVVLQQPSMLTPHSGLYFLHLFGRLSEAAAAHKAEFAQSQNWLNQQVRNGIREREGSTISDDRQLEISRVDVPLVRAAHGVSLLRSQYGESLKILMIVVALVLLIACANLANFLLSRAATRRHEILTRLALGSSRMRIVRQGLIETFLLSIVGGLMGLGVAFAATRALIAFVSRGNAYVDMSPTPNLDVLLFTLGVSLLTGILFGLAPSINAARIGSRGTLSAGARTAAERRRQEGEILAESAGDCSGDALARAAGGGRPFSADLAQSSGSGLRLRANSSAARRYRRAPRRICTSPGVGASPDTSGSPLCDTRCSLGRAFRNSADQRRLLEFKYFAFRLHALARRKTWCRF